MTVTFEIRSIVQRSIQGLAASRPRILPVLVGVIAIGTMSGCGPAPLEIFSENPKGHSGPTVNQIVRHIDCELEQAVNDKSRNHMDDLERYEFLSQAALTLDVTDTEGVNPSVSFISPYAPIGKATSSTTNATLSVGAQLSGIQHRNIGITIQMDMHKLWDGGVENLHGKLVELEGRAGLTDSERSTVDNANCDIAMTAALNDLISRKLSGNPSPGNSEATASSDGNRPLQLDDELRFDESAIKGDLGLREALEDALAAVYANGSLAAPPVSPPAPSPTAFTSQIDFTVTEGINGGPNWTLVHFKGPGGGGGSGGGPGSGGGNSSSGSASSGGSQGPLNFNRQAKDTLLFTFTPRCDSKEDESNPDPTNYLETLQPCTPKPVHGAKAISNLDRYTPAAVNTLQNATTNAILQSLSSSLQ